MLCALGQHVCLPLTRCLVTSCARGPWFAGESLAAALAAAREDREHLHERVAQLSAEAAHLERERTLARGEVEALRSQVGRDWARGVEGGLPWFEGWEGSNLQAAPGIPT